MLILLCLAALAQDPQTALEVYVEEAEDTEESQQTVQQASSILTKASSIDVKLRYLADKKKVEDGLCPVGWVQPPIEEYEAPGAPVSFIPELEPEDVPVDDEEDIEVPEMLKAPPEEEPQDEIEIVEP